MSFKKNLNTIILFFLIFVAAIAGYFLFSQLSKPTTQINPLPHPQTQTLTSNKAIVKPTPSSKESFTVIKVIDGDTIKVSNGKITETVRLIGIDAPETVDPEKPIQCFGAEASQAAQKLLSNKTVTLENDPTQDDRDKYSRLLRYIWLENGDFFNEQMIRNGYAREYTYLGKPYKYQKEFKLAETEAKNSKRGFWSACPKNSQ